MPAMTGTTAIRAAATTTAQRRRWTGLLLAACLAWPLAHAADQVRDGSADSSVVLTGAAPQEKTMCGLCWK